VSKRPFARHKLRVRQHRPVLSGLLQLRLLREAPRWRHRAIRASCYLAGLGFHSHRSRRRNQLRPGQASNSPICLEQTCCFAGVVWFKIQRPVHPPGRVARKAAVFPSSWCSRGWRLVGAGGPLQPIQPSRSATPRIFEGFARRWRGWPVMGGAVASPGRSPLAVSGRRRRLLTEHLGLRRRLKRPGTKLKLAGGHPPALITRRAGRNQTTACTRVHRSGQCRPEQQHSRGGTPPPPKGGRGFLG